VVDFQTTCTSGVPQGQQIKVATWENMSMHVVMASVAHGCSTLLVKPQPTDPSTVQKELTEAADASLMHRCDIKHHTPQHTTHLCEVSCVVLVARGRAVEVIVLDLCSSQQPHRIILS
jgi:hypothetical protein